MAVCWKERILCCIHLVQDTDGKWYYFNIAAYMETDSITPDGYYVDASGVWDGNPSAKTEQDNKSLGPGVVNQ